MNSSIFILSIIILLVIIFDVTNGFHDASNMVGTLIASRALTPAQSIGLVSLFTLLGPIFGGTAVADTIGGFVNIQQIPLLQAQGLLLSGVLAAVVWNLLTWKFSLPSSSSHALVGGVVGVVMAAIGPAQVVWGFNEFFHGQAVGVTKIILALFISPLFGFGAGYILHRGMTFITRGARPSLNRTLCRVQWLTASAMAFSHGTNDAQKGMGVITLLLVTSGYLQDFQVPLWVVLLSALAITSGTLLGGWKIIRTVGYGLYRLRPLHGLDAQLASAAVIFSASLVGGPVSTTHVVSTSIMGVGASERPHAVHWGMAGQMALAWLITLPGTAFLACGIYWLIQSVATVV